MMLFYGEKKGFLFQKNFCFDLLIFYLRVLSLLWNYNWFGWLFYYLFNNIVKQMITNIIIWLITNNKANHLTKKYEIFKEN